MSINEGTYGEFANELQDEDQLDAHPPPGIEIGYDTQRDCGSGSYAEDGRREVREDRPIMDGENPMIGSAAMYGPTEIGEGLASQDGQSEIGFGGFDDDELGALAARSGSAEMKYLEHIDQVVTDMAQRCYPNTAAAHGMATGPMVAARRGLRGVAQVGSHYPTQGAAELGAGHYPTEGMTEIGAGEDTLGDDSLTQPFESFMMGPERIGCDEMGSHYPSQGAAELGSAAMYGPTEIGAGLASQDGQSEIGEGWAAADGQSEIGALYPTNGLHEMGAGYYPVDGASEIGIDDERAHEEWYDDIQHLPSGREIGMKAAVVKVVEKARDNRQPAPPMKAVDVDAPLDENEDTFLSDIVVGATVAAPGKVEPFPLLSQLLLRAGVNVEPRIVRVDTEESYKQFRTAQSPALSEVKALSDRLEAHIVDPNAHELDSEDIDDDIEDLVHLGEEAQATEAQKRVDLWMPKRFDGKVEAWKQGDTVCVSMALPGRDGDVRICTSIEPMRKCIEEMCRHAGEAQVGHHVADVLPEMGCVLGAGTVMKEMAAAAPAILARPEAQVKLPFVVRIEPKTSPNLAALVMLAAGARQGNMQAANEWAKLASMSAPAVKLAMLEAAAVAKSATEG